jgi:hypothetical protein
MSGDGWDELLARATERAEASPIPSEWGYRVALDEGDSFVGRWRGETEDPDNVDKQGRPRRIFLLWDTDGQPAFSRSYAALNREVDRVRPNVGDRVAIARAADYTSAEGTGFSFGLEADPCDHPLPDDPSPGEPPAAADPDDLPF